MKICHIITRLIVGGAQENTLLSCRGLAERGHDVALLAGPETGAEGSLWNDADAGQYHVIRLQHMRRNVNPIADVRALRELKRALNEWQPDVVHTHSSKAGILGRAAAVTVGVPYIVHTIHGMSFNRLQPPVVRGLYRRLERRAARKSHVLVAVADAMIEQCVAAGVAPREKFVTIPSGMETDRYKPDVVLRRKCRAEWNVQEDEVVVGTVARMFDNKGYEDILSALPKMAAAAPMAKFVWIGGGARQREYASRVARLGLSDRVVIEGLIPPVEVARKLTGFDVLVHASRWEGLPRVVVQGLLTEVPAVSYDNDGAPEVVRHDETGLLVPFGDVKTLASQVVRLVHDRPRRAVLGRAGRARCLATFDWRRMVDDLERLYAGLVESRS